MKATPTAMKAPRCPELPTARKKTPKARNTALGVRDLAGDGGAAAGARCSAMFGGSAIYVSAVADPDDDNFQLRVADGIDDAIAAGTDSVPVFDTSQLLVTWWPWVFRQRQ